MKTSGRLSTHQMERTGLDQELELINWVVPRTNAVESERSSTLEVIRDKYVHYAEPLTGHVPTSSISTSPSGD